MKTQFTEYSIDDYNIVTGTDIKATMTFAEAVDEIEKEEVNYFYVSMRAEDVLEAIENEKEMAEILTQKII